MPFSLSTIFLFAALVGGGLLVLQILATLLGGHGDVDGDVDGIDGHGDGGGPLSFRTIIAFVTFFGIGGKAALGAGLSPVLALGVAAAAGTVAFWLVGLAMLQLSRLRSSGNLEIENAVGVEGRVYLGIPAARAGTGAVTVAIQGRSVQFKAVTRGAALATGQLCKVVAVHAGDTLEVEAS